MKNLPRTINIIKVQLNNEQHYQLDIEQDWIKELLIEMNEHATEKKPEEYLEDTFLDIDLTITKKYKEEMGEYLLVNGAMSSTYATECIRTLKPMTMDLDLEFRACFLDEKFEKDELYVDIDEVFEDGEVYELYFFSKNTIKLQEMIHEQIYLQYNQYPVLDPDAKLDTGTTDESV
jgi:uncharacterized metal-binding protein YceD (DUF177 family)